MATPKIVLFDFASRGKNVAWNYNVWKTRALLNFKGLEYETKFLDGCDIAPTLKAAGVPQNEPGQTHMKPYTLPAIKMGDEYIMDSVKIAAALEARFPTPAARVDNPKAQEVDSLVFPCWKPVRDGVGARIWNNVATQRTVEYMAANEGAPHAWKPKENEKIPEEAWVDMKEPWTKMTDLIEGPYMLGEEISYADFVLVGLLQFIRRNGEDLFEKVIKMNPKAGTIYDKCKPYIERDDH